MAFTHTFIGVVLCHILIAENVLECLRTRTRWSHDLEKNIWNAFKEECRRKNIKPNIKVNPLRPSDEGKESLVKFVWDVSNSENKTIAGWAFRMIGENRIREAHNSLKTIWGVGDKIASFYLRDIFWLGHGRKPPLSTTINDDYLLQPVDIWVERAANALGNKQRRRSASARSGSPWVTVRVEATRSR